MTQCEPNLVTRRSALMSAKGFTLVESMVALVVLSIGVIGTIGMCEWAERGLQRGALTTTALALAESRLEAKRSVAWERLLMDDVDQDGIVESVMHDDGLQDAVLADVVREFFDLRLREFGTWIVRIFIELSQGDDERTPIASFGSACR